MTGVLAPPSDATPRAAAPGGHESSQFTSVVDPGIARELMATVISTIHGDRDREVLERRLGLGPHAGPQTLAAVADDLGLTRERARQLQERALQHLASPPGGGGPLLRRHAQRKLVELFDADDRTGLPPGSLLLTITELGFAGHSPDKTAGLLTRTAGFGKTEARRWEESVRELIAERRRPAKTRARDERSTNTADDRISRFLDHAQWPSATTTQPQPTRPLEPPPPKRWFSQALGREVGYGSDRELTVLKALDRSSLIADFCERPVAVPFMIGAREYVHRPHLVATTTDGRVLMVEVFRLEEMALTLNRVKYAAARKKCEEKGWGSW